MNTEDGIRIWKNSAGQLHRLDGPAIEWSNGTKEWWFDDQLHQTDGPAVEWANGYKAWFVNDQLHRTDGPAIEYANGTKKWWFRHKKVSKSEVVHQVCQLQLKVLLLARTINPFCEINVAKYAL
jgi:hypothetical protein